MNKIFKIITVLALLAHLMTACALQSVQAEPAKADTIANASYQSVLGKSLNDKDVADFIAINNCVSAAEFQVCRDAGMAFWLDTEQIVKTVHLYLNNVDGFAAYKGELPFGLKFYDSLGAVEYKLKARGVGNAGLPDESASPDHLHYWAMYKQVGVTIIYNAPFPDEDATIHAILLSQSTYTINAE
jgi:hypothetical protein